MKKSSDKAIENILNFLIFAFLLFFNFSVFSAPSIPISSLTDLTKIGNDPAFPLSASYILTQDIDASETRSWPGGFDPIGDYSMSGRFAGIFDGDGHAIFNLYIDRPTEEYVGFFSFIDSPSAIVTALKLINLEISGKNIVGGIAGVIARGTIKGCVVTGSIQASGNCGGLGGIIGASPIGTSVVIDRCYTLGTIKWNDLHPLFKFNFGGLGGLLAGTAGSVEILNSFSRMNIRTSITDMQYVGGLGGRLQFTVNVVNCYSTGEVPDGSFGIGGLVGYADDPNLVQNSVWDIETSTQTNSAGGKGLSTNEMQQPATYSDMGWDISEVPCANCPTTWSIYKEWSYPFLCDISKKIPDVSGLELSDAIKMLNDQGFDVELVGVMHNTIPPNTAIETVPGRDCYFPCGDKVVLVYCIGPYPPIYISTIEELQRIGNDPGYPEDNEYRLANDIDASDTINWNGGAGFIPISSFSGIFNGNGFKISKLYISDDTGLPTGLFREIKKPRGDLGRVHNLIIEDAEIYGVAYTGILAGQVYSSVPETTPTLHDIATSGNVFGVNTVGGLVGIIRGGLTVHDCSIRANIHEREITKKITYEKFGGVCGHVQGCTLWRISYIGSIFSELGVGRYFGGIAGYADVDPMIGGVAYILDSYAHANLQTDAVNDYVGGLIGFADVTTEIWNSYSASTFTSVIPTTGGLIGGGNMPITVNSSYWDKEISGVSDSFGGGIGEATENMKKQSTFTGWDFIWYWGINENESYPILRQDLMRMTNLTNLHYENGKAWLLSHCINVDFDYLCSNVVPIDYIISQSVPEGAWVRVFSFPPVILTVSTGLCPPIMIGTIEEIALIGKDPAYPPDGNYYVNGDVDASDTRNWNGGAGFEPISNFTGIFDGGGHIIFNLYINRPTWSLVGLFGQVESSGRVRNVYLKNADITGYWGVGILAGRNLGVIHNCGVHGLVKGNSGSLSIGSLVGANEMWIHNCLGVAQVIGDEGVGGLIGTNVTSPFVIIHDNYFWGTLEANDVAGGFVGYNTGNIENSYAVPKVNFGKASIGGFCGLNDGGIISSCYWDKEYGGIETSDGGEGKTTAEMMSQSTFSTWDFISTWTINEGVTYPFLINNKSISLGDERGELYEVIRSYLEGLGMLTTKTERCDWVYGEGVIIDHTYRGLLIPIFTNIDFIVSIGLCTTVPNVVGLTQGDAETEILNAELVLGTVTYECNNVYPVGVVFEQSPVGGEVVVKGSPVDIKVSTGPCPEGEGEGVVEGTPDGEGVVEGTPEGEGVVEGTPEGEGVIEGTPDGSSEGTIEGENPPHSADTNGNWKIDLSELLRVIQFFNIGGYHCALPGEESEDGYIPGYEGDKSCMPHKSDYNTQDWKINLSELLRLIQFFNSNGYHSCEGSEDGYCPDTV